MTTPTPDLTADERRQLRQQALAMRLDIALDASIRTLQDTLAQAHMIERLIDDLDMIYRQWPVQDLHQRTSPADGVTRRG